MHDLPTRGIANKGFSGLQRFVTRFNLIGLKPQSLTVYTVNH